MQRDTGELSVRTIKRAIESPNDVFPTLASGNGGGIRIFPTLSRRIVLTSSLITIFLSLVPLLGARIISNSDDVFLWIHNHDVLQYWAFIRQASTGSFLLTNPFSPLHDRPVYFSVYFTIIGLISSFVAVRLELLYYASYILCAAFLLYQLYNYCKLLFPGHNKAALAYVLLLGSAGFGWIVVLSWMIMRRDWDFLLNPRYPVIGTGGLAQDVSGNGMHIVALLTNPLNTLAMGLFVLGLCSTYRLVSRQAHLCDFLYANAVALVLPLTHPYTGLAYVATIGLYAAYELAAEMIGYVHLQRHTAFFGIGTPAALGSMALIAPALALGADPVVRNIASLRYTVPFVYFAWALMPSIVFAPLGIQQIVSEARNRPGNMLLVLWAFAGFLCMQNGLIIPWRFTHVTFIPVILLGIFGMYKLCDITRRPLARYIVQILPVMLLIMPLPSLCLWSVAQTTITRAPWINSAGLTYFVSHDEAFAFEWLRSEHRAGTEVVLASMSSGAPIAGMTGLRVVTGHNSLEIDADEKRKMIGEFYQNPYSASSMNFLKKYRVGLVFLGPREKMLGLSDMRAVPYLDEIFSYGSVSVYRVMKDKMAVM